MKSKIQTPNSNSRRSYLTRIVQFQPRRSISGHRRCSRELLLALLLFTLMPANLPAQLHIILHCFSNSSDGRSPSGPLTLCGNALYGTAAWGGTNGNGTLFQLNADGGGFAVFKEFSPGANNAVGVFTNGDGCSPNGGLLLNGGAFYGTTASGGTNGYGTVFQIGTNGTGYAVLRHFAAAGYSAGVWTNADGKDSSAGLVLSGATLFGTAQNGGTNGHGTIFKLNTNGSGFTVLHHFKRGLASDGGNPNTHLVLTGNTLYGTTRNGGANNNGTVFKINTNGNGFALVWTFSAANYDSVRRMKTNSDGAIPAGGLTLSGNTLFGTVSAGGSLGGGPCSGSTRTALGSRCSRTFRDRRSIPARAITFTARTAGHPRANWCQAATCFTARRGTAAGRGRSKVWASAPVASSG